MKYADPRWIVVALALALTELSLLAKLNVVATTADLGAIATEIGGDQVEIVTLARPTEDPHFVDAKPSFIVKLSKANALIEGGAELETAWLAPLLDGARNSKLAPGAPGRIECAQGISLLELPTSLDRSKGDIHAAGNPHYLIAPSNAKIVAHTISEAFCQLDSQGCERYRANLKRFTDQLDTKMVEWRRMLAPYRGAQIVSYHNSWPYFAKEFELRIDLFLEPKPGIPPSPSHLATVIAAMKENHVKVIFLESYLSRRTAETVTRNTGATILPVSQFPGAIKGIEPGYVSLLDYLVTSLAKALAP